MDLGVADGLNLMGLVDFEFCFWVLCSGSGWVAGWIFGEFWWAFTLWWVGMGYGVGLGGFVRWLLMVGGFWSIPIPVVMGVCDYCFFIANKNNNNKIINKNKITNYMENKCQTNFWFSNTVLESNFSQHLNTSLKNKKQKTLTNIL